MSKKFAWSRHSDDEIWRGGPCDTIKECVEEALAEDMEMTDTFALGYLENYCMDLCFADYLIEYLQEDAYDEVGEVAYDWLDSVSKEQRESLNNKITEVIKEWLEEIHEEPSFYKVLPCKECTLEEALTIYQDQIKNIPKGGKVCATRQI